MGYILFPGEANISKAEYIGVFICVDVYKDVVSWRAVGAWMYPLAELVCGAGVAEPGCGAEAAPAAAARSARGWQRRDKP